MTTLGPWKKLYGGGRSQAIDSLGRIWRKADLGGRRGWVCYSLHVPNRFEGRSERVVVAKLATFLAGE